LSLATRCPACGTVFRVVKDQLKVSEGWVRCGRCSEVFNAVDGLFDLERDGASPITEPALSVDHVPLEILEGNGEAVHTAQLQAAFHGTPVDPATDRHADKPAADPAPHTAYEVISEAPHDAEVAPPVGAADTPDFIHRANRAARWQHPVLRLGMMLLAVLLAALLAVQFGLQYRDGLAANWPPARPWLERACAAMDCIIEAPRRIESLSVDSSGLLRIEGSPLYRLSLVLQNKASTEVLMPAIDLTVTDTQGQALARRVLYASELGNATGKLPALGDAALQGTLNLGDRRIAGYTVELFYP
jgi:predicted Zn finger-like uncharacterized protein